MVARNTVGEGEGRSEVDEQGRGVGVRINALNLRNSVDLCTWSRPSARPLCTRIAVNSNLVLPERKNVTPTPPSPPPPRSSRVTNICSSQDCARPLKRFRTFELLLILIINYNNY